MYQMDPMSPKYREKKKKTKKNEIKKEIKTILKKY